jgi:penicillin amidase
MDEAQYRVEGLTAPVEVLLDEWGIPHIYASGEGDLYFAQGFNSARDRLFQIDLWRRRGLGLLSEVFGAECLPQDRALRLFLYRGDMQEEWAAYGPGTADIASSFVAGINAYIDLCLEDLALLPEEFSALGYLPSRWHPDDIARIRSHGLYQNLEQEVMRARTLAEFGPEVEDLRRVREPAVEITVPEGIDLSSIPEDVLEVYRLAVSPAVVPPAIATGPGHGQGSNNWVLGGTRTSTGRPLLANDPHRAIGLPGLRYLSHLVTPSMDVIGAGEPALPGISIGHNGTIAFGLTIFSIDQEDLYVYETHPDDPARYRYKDGWEDMVTVVEEVPVRGGNPVPVTLQFTRHGPVVRVDPEHRLAFAVRAAWLGPGMAPYLGSVNYMGARTWDEFTTAMNRWGAPGENQVFADVDGNIGWAAAGRVPVRPNWDGLLPVPGDGRYEWAGFHPADQLPRRTNPETGWLATANEMNLPDDYPNDEQTVGYDWYSPVRYQRIAERLEDLQDATITDCLALQTDYLSVPARTIVEFLRSVNQPGSPELSLLQGWDGVESTDSAAAALFEVWFRRHFRPAYMRAALARVVPEDQVEAALQMVLPPEQDTGDTRADLAVIADPERFLGAGGRTRLEQIAVATLKDAVADVARRLGPDKEQWSWGRLHHALLIHPAAAALGPEAASWTTLGPLPRGGSGDTVGATTYLEDFRQAVGASFRIIVDVGNWDASVAMNSPGQSGRPESPHYDDLFRLWAEDGHFPLLYSRDAVEAHTTERFALVPQD